MDPKKKKKLFFQKNKQEKNAADNATAQNKPIASDLKKIKLLVTVIPRNKTEFYMDFLTGFEVNFQTSVLAHGTARSEMLYMLGLEDSDKSVIFSAVREDNASKALRGLDEKFQSIKDGKGIAFTIPMSSVVGVAIYQFFKQQSYLFDRKGGKIIMEYRHEAIFCIVNSGYSEAVMDAAKKFGARGGTVINARGTAGKEAETFFHITIEPEKEIVMILIPTEIKNAVLRALYEEVGLNTPGQGIAFAVPVDGVVGIAPKAEN